MNADQVLQDLDGRIDMVIDAGACPIGVSSTVADMSGNELRILRTGIISRAEIEEKIGKYGKI